MPPFATLLPPPAEARPLLPRVAAPPPEPQPYEILTPPPALFAAGEVMGKMWGTDSWAVSGSGGVTPPGNVTAGRGLTLNGDALDLNIAGTVSIPASLGGVIVTQARSATQGLVLAGGDLSVPLATPLLAGAMVDAPNNLTQYGRQGLAWTPITAAAPLNYRIGIDLVGGTNVDLLPANTNGEIGGVTVPLPRSATQGLDFTGTALSVPLATKENAGAVLDPPADGRLYARRSSVVPNSPGEWAPAAMAAVFTHLENFTVTGTEAPNSPLGTPFTIPAASLPAVPFLWAIAMGGDGAAFLHNFNGPALLNAGSLQLQFQDGATWEAVTSWNFATAVFPAGGPSLSRGTVAVAGANRLRQYSGAGGIQFRLFVGATPLSGPATMGLGIEGQILQFT
jgi:hypothetical protein